MQVLLIHGLTGSPQDFGELAEALKKKGHRIYSPTLRGHSTSLTELSKTTYREWLTDVESEFDRLLSERTDKTLSSSKILLIGSSLGALLALNLLADEATKVDGIVLLAPPFALNKLTNELLLSLFSIAPDCMLPTKYTFQKSSKKKALLDLPHESYDRHSFFALCQLIKLRRRVLRQGYSFLPKCKVIIDSQDYHIDVKKTKVRLENLFIGSPEHLSFHEIESAGHEVLLGYKRERVSDLIFQFMESIDAT